MQKFTSRLELIPKNISEPANASICKKMGFITQNKIDFHVYSNYVFAQNILKRKLSMLNSEITFVTSWIAWRARKMRISCEN